MHPDIARDMRVDQRACEHGFAPHFRRSWSRLEGQLKMISSFKDGEVRSVKLAETSGGTLPWPSALTWTAC